MFLLVLPSLLMILIYIDPHGKVNKILEELILMRQHLQDRFIGIIWPSLFLIISGTLLANILLPSTEELSMEHIYQELLRPHK